MFVLLLCFDYSLSYIVEYSLCGFCRAVCTSDSLPKHVSRRVVMDDSINFFDGAVSSQSYPALLTSYLHILHRSWNHSRRHACCWTYQGLFTESLPYIIDRVCHSKTCNTELRLGIGWQTVLIPEQTLQVLQLKRYAYHACKGTALELWRLPFLDSSAEWRP